MITNANVIRHGHPTDAASFEREGTKANTHNSPATAIPGTTDFR